MRPHQSLDGAWHWSVDPYRDGKAGFHGGGPGSSSNRYADIVQADVAAREPTALFEFDMQRSPVVHLPSAWIGHSPEMRYYNGLVWYQRTFNVTAPRKGRTFIRFGAVDYRADVYVNGKAGRHAFRRLHAVRLRGDATFFDPAAIRSPSAWTPNGTISTCRRR